MITAGVFGRSDLESLSGKDDDMEQSEPSTGVSGVNDELRLAMEPGTWQVELRDGTEIDVMTHGYSIEGDHVVFSLLFAGTPTYEMTSLRIPLALLPADFRW